MGRSCPIRGIGFPIVPARDDARLGAAPLGAIERGKPMPEIVVYLIEGRTLEEKRGLVKDVTAAVVKNLGVPVESVTVSLVETAKTAKGKGGVLFSDMAPR